jgi:hypothetical protein
VIYDSRIYLIVRYYASQAVESESERVQSRHYGRVVVTL